MDKISVLGGGSWGTTLANLLAAKDLNVSIWARDPKIFVKNKNTLINKKYLPKYKLSSKLKIQEDIKEAVLSANLIIIAIPSKDFRKISSKISKYLNNQKILIATKGIENESFMTMSKGIEMAGALKNLYAICSGLSDGLGFESNTKAMLLTRSLSEMSELFKKINANPLTLLGLSGVGDLIATSSSEKSRNYSFGKFLGKGNSPSKALSMVKQSVEGHRTLKVLYLEKKKLSLNMPIIDALYKIVYLKKDPKKCFLKFIHESGNIDTAYD